MKNEDQSRNESHENLWYFPLWTRRYRNLIPNVCPTTINDRLIIVSDARAVRSSTPPFMPVVQPISSPSISEFFFTRLAERLRIYLLGMRLYLYILFGTLYIQSSCLAFPLDDPTLE
jgi:hypothetical protein